MSLMSSSLLVQQCPAYLVRITLIVFVMGGKWPYSCCFVGCCLQDLFNIARSILVSLFNGISTFVGYLMSKPFLEEQKWYYLTHSWEDKRVHTFLKGLCPKVNVIARLGYELAYYDSAVHRFNHYTTRTTPAAFLCNCREAFSPYS